MRVKLFVRGKASKICSGTELTDARWPRKEEVRRRRYKLYMWRQTQKKAVHGGTLNLDRNSDSSGLAATVYLVGADSTISDSRGFVQCWLAKQSRKKGEKTTTSDYGLVARVGQLFFYC